MVISRSSDGREEHRDQWLNKNVLTSPDHVETSLEEAKTGVETFGQSNKIGKFWQKQVTAMPRPGAAVTRITSV